MQLPSLTSLVFSTILLNAATTLGNILPPSAQVPSAGPARKGFLGRKITGPPDLLGYQKEHAAKLRQRCIDLRDRALKKAALPKEVMAYTNGKLTQPYIVMTGMKGKKKEPGSVFTHYGSKKSEKQNIMHSTHDMHVIVNGKSPFLDSYRFDKHSAGQSFLHFLIIPRNNVYNGAVLADDYWIKQSKAAFASFLKSPGWHKKAVDRTWHYANLKEMIKFKGYKKSFEDMSEKSKHLSMKDFAFAYHIGEDASVPHLHMHAIASAPSLRALSSPLHDEKDVPPETLLAVVKASPLNAKNYPGWTPAAVEAAQNKGGPHRSLSRTSSKSSHKSGHHKRAALKMLRRDLAAEQAAFFATE